MSRQSHSALLKVGQTCVSLVGGSFWPYARKFSIYKLVGLLQSLFYGLPLHTHTKLRMLTPLLLEMVSFTAMCKDLEVDVYNEMGNINPNNVYAPICFSDESNMPKTHKKTQSPFSVHHTEHVHIGTEGIQIIVSISHKSSRSSTSF